VPIVFLTTIHAKAREASSEKASRAFYMVFNFVHNQRKTALQSHFLLTVRELRPGRPLVRIQSGAPSKKPRKAGCYALFRAFCFLLFVSQILLKMLIPERFL